MEPSQLMHFYPHDHPSGCYGVVNTHGPSLPLTGGHHHTVFQLQQDFYLKPLAIQLEQIGWYKLTDLDYHQ